MTPEEFHRHEQFLDWHRGPSELTDSFEVTSKVFHMARTFQRLLKRLGIRPRGGE